MNSNPVALWRKRGFTFISFRQSDLVLFEHVKFLCRGQYILLLFLPVVFDTAHQREPFFLSKPEIVNQTGQNPPRACNPAYLMGQNHFKQNETYSYHPNEPKDRDIYSLPFVVPFDVERHLVRPWRIRIGETKLDHGDEDKEITTCRPKGIHIPQGVHGTGC